MEIEDLAPKKVESLKNNDVELTPEKSPVFADDRGFFTPINFKGDSKRAYLIQNHKAGIVRAFHGHKFESKDFYVIRGSFKVICIDMETREWSNYSISERCNNHLFIPHGFYNGFVSLTDDSEVIIITNRTFEESKNDDYRLPYDFLGTEVWEVEHR